jgi:hypothetical protein
LGQALINTSHSIIRGLDFNQEDGFLESWLSSQLASIINSSSSGDDLTTSSVDSISMKGNIQKVESDTSHIFFSHDSFFGSPLESSFHRVFDFNQVLDSFGHIN